MSEARDRYDREFFRGRESAVEPRVKAGNR